jgi:hypothetical protein
LKIVKFTALWSPRVQLGGSSLFCKRTAVPRKVWTSPFSQVAHLSQPQ